MCLGLWILMLALHIQGKPRETDYLQKNVPKFILIIITILILICSSSSLFLFLLSIL